MSATTSRQARPRTRRRSLRELFEHWLRARAPRQPSPATLTRRRIYILPTRFGYGYGALLIVMLLGAMNYGNSMAFALTFLLSGIGFVVMHHTHANLINLTIAARAPRPVFAGHPAQFDIELGNPSRRSRYAITLAWPRHPTGSGIDIPAQGTVTATLGLETSRRGWLNVPRFVISSEFPLGLFHAWSSIELDLRTLVYPRPAGHAHPTGGSDNKGTKHEQHHSGTDDFAALREYQPGDSLRLLDWKRLARQPQPMVKQFAMLADDDLWLDWDSLGQLDAEARLSQLTRWLLSAESRHRNYGLRIPGTTRAPGHGSAHRLACLRTLALFERDQIR